MGAQTTRYKWLPEEVRKIEREVGRRPTKTKPHRRPLSVSLDESERVLLPQTERGDCVGRIHIEELDEERQPILTVERFFVSRRTMHLSLFLEWLSLSERGTKSERLRKRAQIEARMGR